MIKLNFQVWKMIIYPVWGWTGEILETGWSYIMLRSILHFFTKLFLNLKGEFTSFERGYRKFIRIELAPHSCKTFFYIECRRTENFIFNTRELHKMYCFEQSGNLAEPVLGLQFGYNCRVWITASLSTKTYSKKMHKYL